MRQLVEKAAKDLIVSFLRMIHNRKLALCMHIPWFVNTQKFQQRHAEESMSTTIGIRLEQTRQLKTIQRSSEFINYLRSVLPPADFLRHWLSHARLIKNLMFQSNQEPAADVQIPVLKLEASLTVSNGSD